jgi:hypothetical protein
MVESSPAIQPIFQGIDDVNAIEVEQKLLRIVDELSRQPEVGRLLPSTMMSFDEQIVLLREYLRVDECSLAYESLVALLESYPFQVSGAGAVALLEVGLFYGFKTGRPEDKEFVRSGNGA